MRWSQNNEGLIGNIAVYTLGGNFMSHIHVTCRNQCEVQFS
jgi:hypothetical protein